jgi:hypothetical protein
MVTAEQAATFMRNNDTAHEGGIYKEITPLWDLSPSELLTFADNDLARGSDRYALVNALSNAKRALHCQVDSILYSLGLLNISPNSIFFKQA